MNLWAISADKYSQSKFWARDAGILHSARFVITALLDSRKFHRESIARHAKRWPIKVARIRPCDRTGGVRIAKIYEKRRRRHA